MNTALGDWTLVARAEDFPPGTRRVVDVGGVRVVVFNLDGDYHALEDVCTHDGGELASGTLEGCEIVCPRHGARFDARTGAVTAPPANEPVPAMAMREVDGWVWVRDPRWD
jgi:3-phenylpropionate/trans-cinnamate dioxygenase ferredoxin subunit